MFKSKTKYTWEGWESSGREDWVFSVKHPCELIGVHAKLIDAQLKESEKVEYCIYSPRISSTSTPFGLKAAESSSGVCVTDARFIISNNKHIKGIESVLTSINFEDILYVTIGSAMLLSWFSVGFISRGESKRLTILFSSNGKHHFQKALRVFKKHSLALNADDFKFDSFSPTAFIHRIKDKIHRDYLKVLITDQEKCVETFSCRYVWEKVINNRSLLKRKNRVAYLTSNATVLLTTKALMIARDAVESSIGISVDILLIPLDRIAKVLLSEEDIGMEVTHKLRVSFLPEAKNNSLDITLMSLDEDAKIVIDNIQSLFNNK